MKMKFDLLKDTKTCYRFENKDGGNLTTLYLKKADIEDAGIDPHKGIIVTVEEAK